MDDYVTLPDPQAATVISTRIATWDSEEPLRYAAIGLMAHEVWRRLLWQHATDPANGLPCRSFARWVRVYAPNGYSTVYAAMRDVEALPDVPAEDIAQLPQSSFKTLKQLSTAVRRDPEVLAAAKSGKNEALVAHVQKHHPDQHLEEYDRVVFNLTHGAKSEIDEAVDLAIERGDSRTKEEWLLMVAIDYKQECENVGMLADTPDAECGHA